MTDFTRDWIAKREQLEQAATEGPWWTTRDMSPADVFAGYGSADDVALATDIEEPADAKFIADARTALPAALAALRAVLAVHQGRPCYGEPGDDACPHDSEYEGGRHFEAADGWTFCEDTAGDDLHCSECTHADDDELTDWPCPTIAAVEAALRGES